MFIQAIYYDLNETILISFKGLFVLVNFHEHNFFYVGICWDLILFHVDTVPIYHGTLCFAKRELRFAESILTK